MRKYLLAAVVVTLTATACNKDRNYTRAVVLDSGDITQDGCGYLLRLEDGREEKPQYLPAAYQHNGLKVLVKYRSTGILDTCEFTAPRRFFELVQIDDIKKQLD
jgi:hypothetical protein